MFLGCHLTAVRLVVITRQMQDAMKYKDFDLVGNRMSKIFCVFPGNLRGYRNISGNIASWTHASRKRQHVCGLVLIPKVKV
jgi:hypothetical protein